MAGKHSIGWIGLGRMGEPMAAYLVKAGNSVKVWNRTKAKAEPLAKLGAQIVDTPAALAGCDVVFLMVSTGKDVEQVCFGKDGVASGGKGRTPKIFVDCSSISAEESAEIRGRLAELGAELIAAPVSGNAKVIRAGQLSAVASGPTGDPEGGWDTDGSCAAMFITASVTNEQRVLCADADHIQGMRVDARVRLAYAYPIGKHRRIKTRR